MPKQRSRRGQVTDSLVWGALLGASSSAVLVAPAAAPAGAIVWAAVEAFTTLRQGIAQPKPLGIRITASALLMSLLGALLGLVCGPLATGLIAGALLGVLGLRP